MDTIIENAFEAMTPAQQLGTMAGMTLLGLINAADAAAKDRAEAEAAHAAAVKARKDAEEIERLRKQAEERLRIQLRAERALQNMKDRSAAGSARFKTGADAFGDPATTGTAAAPRVSREAELLQQSVLSQDWPRAAGLLDDALQRPQAATSRDVEMGVVQAGVEMFGEEGLLAFQRANNEYRLLRDDHSPLFSGSAIADARLEAGTRALLRMDVVLRDDVASRAVEASASADELRQAILMVSSGHPGSLLLLHYSTLLASLPASAPGESDAETIAFIKEGSRGVRLRR